MCTFRFLAVILTASFFTSAFALEPDQVYAKVAPSVVVVVGYKSNNPTDSSFGSGVVIAPGQIVTNCHVIDGADLIYVRHEKVSSVATLRFTDPDRDLCQVTAVEKSQFSSAITGVVSVSELRVGQRVYAVGAPQGLDLTLSDGLISSLRTMDEGTVIQTNAPISPGSSGGGLFDASARLIGITSFYHTRGQNLNFAIPASWILELPTRHVEREEHKSDTVKNRNETNTRKQAVAQRLEKQLQEEETEFRHEEERLKQEVEIKERRRAEAEQKRIEIERERIKAQEKQAQQERFRKEEEARQAEEQRRAEQQRRVDEAREVEQKRQEMEAQALAQWRQGHDSAYEIRQRELKKWPATDVIAEIEDSHIPRGFVADWYDNEKNLLREDRERAEDRRQLAVAVELEREEELRQRAADAAERERQQREADEAKRKAEAAARAAQQKLIDDWKVRIQAKIKSRVVVPRNMEGNPQAMFEVVLLPGGEVLSATLKKPSGDAAYDAAVERAISAAQPLPVPTDTDLFHESFRELNLLFRPKD